MRFQYTLAETANSILLSIVFSSRWLELLDSTSINNTEATTYHHLPNFLLSGIRGNHVRCVGSLFEVFLGCISVAAWKVPAVLQPLCVHKRTERGHRCYLVCNVFQLDLVFFWQV